MPIPRLSTFLSPSRQLLLCISPATSSKTSPLPRTAGAASCSAFCPKPEPASTPGSTQTCSLPYISLLAAVCCEMILLPQENRMLAYGHEGGSAQLWSLCMWPFQQGKQQGAEEHLEENSFSSEHSVPQAHSPLEYTQVNIKAARANEQKEQSRSSLRRCCRTADSLRLLFSDKELILELSLTQVASKNIFTSTHLWFCCWFRETKWGPNDHPGIIIAEGSEDGALTSSSDRRAEDPGRMAQ